MQGFRPSNITDGEGLHMIIQGIFFNKMKTALKKYSLLYQHKLPQGIVKHSIIQTTKEKTLK